MRNIFLSISIAIGLFFGLTGCDRVSNPNVMKYEEPPVVAVAESESWAVHTDGYINGEVVRVNHRSDRIQISIGGPNSSPIIGVGSPLPDEYFGDGTFLIQEIFEQDIVDTEFGASLALYERALYEHGRSRGPYPHIHTPIPMVGHSGALLAVGAPEDDNGVGAVFVFRIGSYGLWLEAKLTPTHERTRGFGSEIQFLTSPEGDAYLAVQSKNGAEAATYHISSFLSIG